MKRRRNGKMKKYRNCPAREWFMENRFDFLVFWFFFSWHLFGKLTLNPSINNLEVVCIDYFHYCDLKCQLWLHLLHLFNVYEFEFLKKKNKKYNFISKWKKELFQWERAHKRWTLRSFIACNSIFCIEELRNGNVENI